MEEGEEAIICSTLREPRSVRGVYGFLGMWNIKVVHFGYSTYVWPTCKAMVVVLSHPLKRLSAISMLSIYGPLGPSLLFA